MGNQVCRVCAETYPSNSTNCPRCGFGSGTSGSPVQAVDSGGYAVHDAPASVSSPAVHYAAADAARKSAAPVLIGIAVFVLALLGGAGFIAMQVFSTVSDVTHEITDTVGKAIDDARVEPGTGTGGGLSSKQCVTVVTRFSNSLIESFTDGEEVSRVLQQASTELDQFTLQALIAVVSDVEVATAASQGKKARAKTAAEPVIAQQCDAGSAGLPKKSAK